MPEVMVKGTRIHYLSMNAKKSDSVGKIVFVHGSGGNACLWQKAMEELRGEYESLAVSLPGHGESQGEGMKTIPEYREFLKDFLNTLGLENIVLGGHSLGGGIVQDFALRYPGGVKALLLIGTGARLRVLPEALEALRQMAEGLTEPKFEPWGFAENASPEILAEGKREWAKTGSEVRYQDLLACDRFDIMAELEKIRLPALILCGREDRLTPVKYADYLHKKIAGSKMEIIEGAGHMVMLEAPGALSRAILKFLSS